MMKKYFIRILILLVIATIFYSCRFTRFVRHSNKDLLSHHELFSYRELNAGSEEVFHFYSSDETAINPNLEQVIKGYNRIIQTRDIGEEPMEPSDETFESFLQSSKTAAFLIIKKDTILYEGYFNGYERESILPSFSVAKSFTSLLIGCAIDDGLIESVHEPVTNYLPELKKNGFDKVSIRDLLQMTSGIDFHENYSNPFSDAVRIYLAKDLRKAMYKSRLESEPGEKHYYNSGDSQLLGMVLERSLKGKTITQYMQEKIWAPLGMEYNGTWSLDKKNGLEKTFCCLNARAVDYAKIGRLYLNKGNWNGHQIVSENWVEESTKIDTFRGSYDSYQFNWYLRWGSFSAYGHGGQILFVDPSKDLIFYRSGNDRGGVRWDLLFNSIASML